MLYRFLKKLFEKREERKKEDGDVVKPFLDHLEDLRWTIIKMAIVLVISMAVCFFFAHELFYFLEQPLILAGLVPKEVLRSGTVVGPIMSAFQLSFYAGITLSFPILMYFLGEFVLPALTRKEKRYILPALLVGFALFLGGAAFCFWRILPMMIKWLSDYSLKNGVAVLYDMKDYFGFVAHLCIAFGLLCELPVVMVTLNAIGVVNYKWLAGTRAYALTGVLVLCAIISPTPDLATLFILAAPIMLLYEACIWIVYYLDKRRAKREAEEEAKGDRPYNDPNEPID
jgi:sec-independent protein translocase protein TatC